MADEADGIEEPDEAPELPKVDYASNSNKSKAKMTRTSGSEPAAADKNISRVVDGDVIQRKKPLGRKFAETFSGENMHEVRDFVLFDVLAPGLKDLLYEMFTQALHRKFYGSARGNRISASAVQAGQTVMRTAYNKISSPAGRPDSAPEMSRHGRATHDFNEIVIADRGQAEQVLDTLVDLVATYGSATVYDLYELVGITGSFPDSKWGWDDLRASRVDRVRDGYLLNLPKTKPMD